MLYKMSSDCVGDGGYFRLSRNGGRVLMFSLSSMFHFPLYDSQGNSSDDPEVNTFEMTGKNDLVGNETLSRHFRFYRAKHEDCLSPSIHRRHQPLSGDLVICSTGADTYYAADHPRHPACFLISPNQRRFTRDCMNGDTSYQISHQSCTQNQQISPSD